MQSNMITGKGMILQAKWGLFIAMFGLPEVIAKWDLRLLAKLANLLKLR